MRRAIALMLAAGIGAAGCGDSSSGDAGRSDRLVDFSKRPPFVNSLERDEESGEFLLTTNRGFFRVNPEDDSVRRVRGRIEAGGKSATVGTFLELDLDPDGQLVGSGHPDQRTLPQYLGYLRSDDGGRNWRVVSRLGDADLHKIVFKHDRLYAWDAVLSALIVSEDGGRSFAEHFTPRGLIIDFEVDPEDPAHVLGGDGRGALPVRGRGRQLAAAGAERGLAARVAGAGPPLPGGEGRHGEPLRGRRRHIRRGRARGRRAVCDRRRNG